MLTAVLDPTTVRKFVVVPAGKEAQHLREGIADAQLEARFGGPASPRSKVPECIQGSF